MFRLQNNLSTTCFWEKQENISLYRESNTNLQLRRLSFYPLNYKVSTVLLLKTERKVKVFNTYTTPQGLKRHTTVSWGRRRACLVSRPSDSQVKSKTWSIFHTNDVKHSRAFHDCRKIFCFSYSYLFFRYQLVGECPQKDYWTFHSRRSRSEIQLAKNLLTFYDTFHTFRAYIVLLSRKTVSKLPTACNRCKLCYPCFTDSGPGESWTPVQTKCSKVNFCTCLSQILGRYLTNRTITLVEFITTYKVPTVFLVITRG